MSQATTDQDTILEEIHRTRERIAAKFGGDIAKIIEDARKRQEASGRAVWQPQKPATAIADESTD